MVRSIEEILDVDNLEVIGKDQRLVNAVPTATAEAKYGADYRPDRLGAPKLPGYNFTGGMLTVKLLRSPNPHARIVDVDASAAEAMDGVAAVLTNEDAMSMAPDHPGKTIPAADKVRYVGDVIAAVAAEDALTAQNATEKIEYELEDLPHTIHAEDGLEPEEYVHDPDEIKEFQGGEGFVNLRFPLDEPTFSTDFGDADAAMSRASTTVERRYFTPTSMRGHMGPHTYIADWNGRKLVLWMDTEELFNKRQDVADGLGIPREDVNIISPYEPGSYGGMRDAGEFASLIAAQLAKETGRPCKLELTRWANLVARGGRLEGVYDMKAGVDDDGRVIAFEGRTIWNQGEHSANFTLTAGMSFTHWFHPENARWEGYEVYSNRKNVWRRSYGSGEHALAYLSFADELAHEAGMDPVDFARKNSAFSHGGEQYKSEMFDEVLDTVTGEIGWDDKWRPPGQRSGGTRRGLGFALLETYGGSVTPVEALVKMDEDGQIGVFTGESNIGVSRMTLSGKVVAEVMGVELEDLHVSWGENYGHGNTGNYSGSGGSRNVGAAYKNAAITLREQVIEHASDLLDASPDEFVIQNGRATVEETGESVSFAEIGSHAGGIEVRQVTDLTENPEYEPYYPLATTAEVEVDLGTGKVTPIRIEMATDLGKAINPIAAKGQMEAGIVEGIESALLGDLTFDTDTGIPIGDNWYQMKPASPLDLPTEGYNVHVFESLDNLADWEKTISGIGEIGCECAPPAVANAVFNATGVRVRDFPIRPKTLIERLDEEGVDF